MSRNRQIPLLQKNVDLQPYNTLKVPAKADQMAVIRKKSHLEWLFHQKFLDNGYWILGEGSNVLLRGRLKRLVLRNEIDFLEILEDGSQKVLLKAGGGMNWHRLVEACVARGWGGIENLALIPGTVGAGPIQNIGAYGVELEERFVSLEAFDLQNGRFLEFEKQACRFGYRDSVFKREFKGRYFITSVTLQLNKSPHEIRRSYRSLDDKLKNEGIEKPGIRDIFDAVVSIRTEKLPDPKDLGNAGSFFKNPVVNRAAGDRLQKAWPEMPVYPAGDSQVKIPAGWLIEKTGWKGKRVGNTGTYDNQALVIVNHGGATGEEIWTLARSIQASVHEKFGIDLVPEVNIIEDNDNQSVSH